MINVNEPQRAHAKDPKKFITPFAFSVSPELYGVALGSPLKRAVAILLDLTVVILLAELSSSLLAALMAMVFWQLSRQFSSLGVRPKLTLCLRVLATLILFSVLSLHFFYEKLSATEFGAEWTVELPEGGDNVSILDAAAYTALAVRHYQLIDEKRAILEVQECPEPAECWQPLINEFATQLLELNTPAPVAKDLLESAVTQAAVSEKDAQRILANLPPKYLEMQKNIVVMDSSLDPNDESQQQEPPAAELENTASKENVPSNVSTDTNKEKSYQGGSIIKFLQGLLADLGLGFGWSAFYFTVMTAWFRGQTVGKLIMGLKVIKLNGEQMGLWESFGRYGGYGAGFATGLSGFFQIYWDPNRQAIQDKISETLVIDIRKPNYEWPNTPQH